MEDGGADREDLRAREVDRVYVWPAEFVADVQSSGYGTQSQDAWAARVVVQRGSAKFSGEGDW